MSPAGGTAGVALTISSQTVVLRCYIYINSHPSSGTPVIFGVRSGAGSAIGLQYVSGSDYKYSVATASISSGAWHEIDFKWTATTVAWYLDGVLVESVASGGSPTYDTLRLGTLTGTPTYDMFFDDMALSYTDADCPIGGGYVNHFVPTADGTHNIAGTGDFQRGNSGTDILNASTTAFNLIDDVPLPSGAVDEADNQRAVAPVNATDYPEVVFGPAPGISTPTFAPRAVEVVLAHHQIATTAGSFDVLLNDNGTTDTIVSASGAAGVTTYRYARKHYAAPPTGGAWKVTSGAGNFLNLRSRFRSADANPDQCLDAIMIEAEFDYVGSPNRKFINQSVNRASTY